MTELTELLETTDLIEPFGVEIDLDTGKMPDATNHLIRRAADMKGYYNDEAALERLVNEQENPVHYEVFEKPVPEQQGQLMFCISALQPGLVGAECFMTKGHYHTKVETAETYLCLRGKGYMMMKTSGGEWRAEPMTRGRMVYVPPYWAHRSINTGIEPLVSYCVYPGDAGHNYGDIATEGFPQRVYLRDGRDTIE